MKKAILSAATFFGCLFSAMVGNAQPKTETTASNAAIESPLFSTANRKAAEKPTGIINRDFKLKAAVNFAGDDAAQPPTYVRPTREERRKCFLSDAFGVPAVIGATFGAAVNQIGDAPPEWRKTAGGFGKRFASSYGTNVVRNTISYGLSETFKLDNRFEKSGEKDFGKRLKHVFLGSYTTRTKTGKRLPDFPFVAGTYMAAVVADEVWYPKCYGYRDGLRDGTISLGVRFGVNLLREFVFPK